MYMKKPDYGNFVEEARSNIRKRKVAHIYVFINAAMIIVFSLLGIYFEEQLRKQGMEPSMVENYVKVYVIISFVFIVFLNKFLKVTAKVGDNETREELKILIEAREAEYEQDLTYNIDRLNAYRDSIEVAERTVENCRSNVENFKTVKEACKAWV